MKSTSEILALLKSYKTANALKYGFARLGIFGSVARNEQTEQSDVDFLVEFKDSAVSLLTLAALKNRMQELLNTDVDIVRIPLTKNALIEPGKVVEVYAA